MAGVVLVSSGCRGEERGGGGGGGKRGKGGEEEEEQQLSLLALLLAAIRRSVVGCRVEQRGEEVVPAALRHMDIGWPTDVRHVAHVTFDRFHGFLGLPVELQVEVPGRVPSASASVFGVSAESMQCSYDSKGNSVPMILLLMQERLYLQGGLKAEGIFRINPENSQEEHVRDQLNKGIVPDDIDVHCLAGLIKAWFRELPEGVLDGLSPEQVLNCNTEEECVELIQQLLPSQAALLNWAIDLMADVVEEEEENKMNARNIAMVFAPNMTQMSDPLTALMHAVQVMNLLKTLILKTLREREEAALGEYSSFSSSPTSDQHDDDFDSQQEVNMSGELRQSVLDDDQVSASQTEVNMSGELRQSVLYDDQVSASQTEACVHGEFGGHTSDDYHLNHCNRSAYEDDSATEIEECFLRRLEWKVEIGNYLRDSTSTCLPFGTQAARLSCSDVNASSCFSASESKQESSVTTDEVDWEESVTRNVVANVRSLSARLESRKTVLLQRKWTP